MRSKGRGMGAFEWEGGCMRSKGRGYMLLLDGVFVDEVEHDDDDGGANDLALYWRGNPAKPYADERAFGTITFQPNRKGELQ